MNFHLTGAIHYHRDIFKMKLRKLTLLFFILMLFGALPEAYPAFLQEEDSPLLKKAAVEYRELRFVSAIQVLLRVIEKEPGNVRAQEMLASSYRNIKNYDEALYWYKELSRQKNIKPEWALYYAEALANKERYEESEQWYRKYLSLKPNDRRAAAFSKANINSFTSNEGQWDIKYLNINTDASEYSPMYYKDGLLFISNRRARTRYLFAWDQTPYTDMYVVDDLNDIKASDDISEASVEQRLSGNATRSLDNNTSRIPLFSQRGKPDGTEAGAKVRLLRSKVRSSYHEGPAVVLPEGSLMFTRNNYNKGRAGKSKSGINKLKLYTATGENWDNIVSFPYNSDEYSTGHPAISPDGSILVFSSDMPRGYGGTDLYYCVRTSENAQWGRPVNMGAKINTEGNEQFPYLSRDGSLYFASTGHPGLGGLDIFKVILKDMKPVGKLANMGALINSPADDFGLIVAPDGKSGYFSSNRKGNDDIYHFSRLIYTITLQGTVVDSKTNIPLGGSKVLLRHNGITDTVQTDATGKFNKVLAKGTDYEISGRRVAYISQGDFISTTGITSDSTIHAVFKLDKVEDVQQWVMDNCASLKKTFNIKNIYYDLDKSYVRDDAKQILDEIAELMKKNPEISIITASHCDSRSSESYNRELSLQRGQAAREYLVTKGIDRSRIEVKYYGKSRLVNACAEGVDCSEADQQLNRRTEFEVVINGINLSKLDCR